MRLFIAWVPDKKVISEITEVQSDLQKFTTGRWTIPANIHMTFAFLGEVPQEKISLIQLIVQSIDLDEEISFDHISTFPAKKGTTLWLGIRKNTVIEEMSVYLRKQLEEKDISYCQQVFIPHITLARDSSYTGKDILLKRDIKTRMSHLVLMSSYEKEGSRIYQNITTGSIRS